MADYILEVPMTQLGRDYMDPDRLSSIISEGEYMVPAVTDNNLTIEAVDYDPETNQVFYYLIASPQMKFGISTGDLAWWNTLLAGAAIAGAVVCVIYAAPVVALGLAVVAASALLYDPVTAYVEVEATKAKTKQQIVELTATPGNPFYENPELGIQYIDAVDKGWGADIPWTTIIIGGMVGIGALAALYIFMKTRN